jgi:hypothetical protein
MPSWAKSKGSGQIPAPRANHAACVLNNGKSYQYAKGVQSCNTIFSVDKIFIFGGLVNDTDTTAEAFVLEI